MQIMSTYHQTTDELQNEKEIIRLAQKDTAHFEVLYKKYYAQIYLFVLKRVEDQDKAKDITSQVFLKALTNLGKYRDMGVPFSAWLFRIARNAIYDLYNANKINMVLSIETRGVEEMISEMQTEEPEKHEDLHAALARLDEDEVELIELRFFEARPFKEVGEILGITENNAKVRTYRVLDKLKTYLK